MPRNTAIGYTSRRRSRHPSRRNTGCRIRRWCTTADIVIDVTPKKNCPGKPIRNSNQVNVGRIELRVGDLAPT
jgi:hypothetical protein